MNKHIVNEASELVVGKMYNVRCAEMKNGFNDNTFAYVPVYGDVHRDPQFGIDYPHYHIDGRFVTERDIYNVNENGESNLILCAKKPSGSYIDYVGKIVIKKRKCRRLTTGINPPANAKRYNAWYKTMAGKSCAGRRCPHLGTLMKPNEGKLVCPLHGLIGDPISEIIICR